MASSSSSAPSLFSNKVSKKLTSDNFLPWKALVLPQIRVSGLYDYLDGNLHAPEKIISSTDIDGKTVVRPNPLYTSRMGMDQRILPCLLNSLSKKVLIHVLHTETYEAVWNTVTNIFTSHSKSRNNNLCISLATAQKETRPCRRNSLA